MPRLLPLGLMVAIAWQAIAHAPQSAATPVSAQPVPPTPRAERGYQSFWWSPSRGTVSGGRGASIEEARAEARAGLGAPDAEEVFWTPAPGFSGVALYRDADGELECVKGYGFRTPAEFAQYAAKRAAWQRLAQCVGIVCHANV